MPVEMLTIRRVETARAENGKLLELRDEKATGLELRVSAGGTKSWSYGYTRQSDGKRRRVPIGPFPAVGLDKARKDATEMQKLVNGGGDPASERNGRREALTFQQMAERRLADDNKLKPRTKSLYREVLTRDVFPAVGGVAATDVSPQQIVSILDMIEARGSRRQADIVKVALG